MTNTVSAKESTAKLPLGLLLVTYGMGFVAAFNENIINVALPNIASTFSVAQAEAQWLITGYMIVTSIVTACMGFLTRRFSTRSLFFFSAACLIVGEASCLVAPIFPLLLVFRLLQAFGSGIFLPLMMIVVLAVAPRERTGLLISIGGACITLGPAFGPVISGLSTTLFGWRAIFVAPLVAAALFALAGLCLSRNVTQTVEVRIDAPSCALLAFGLTAFVFGLGQLSSQLMLGCSLIAASLVVLALFGTRQLHLAEPLLDVRPLLNSRFWPAALLEVVAMMTSFSLSVLLPLYFEGAFGVTPLAAGLLILPAIALNAITSLVGGRVIDKSGPWPLLPAGFALICAGQIGISLVSGNLNLPGTVLASVVVYAGVGLVMSPSQTTGLTQLEPAQQGSGTAILNTLLMVAASIGSSLFVGLLSSGSAAALSSGAPEASAVAAGFSSAIFVAALIAAVGLVASVWYALRTRRNQQEGPSVSNQMDCPC